MDTYDGIEYDPRTLHRYQYALSNPSNNIDPSGNFSFLAAIYGQRVHQMIGSDFELKTGGLSDRTLSTLIGVQIYLRPDLLNVATGEVYEIKPVQSFASGALQLTLYLGLLNYLDPLERAWVPGFSYTPPPVLSLGGGIYAFVYPPVFGIITYNVRNITFDILLVMTLATYQLRTMIAAAALTAQYGY